VSGFDDVLFPLAIGLGARKHVERRIDIVQLSGGREARNAQWRHGRRRYDFDGVSMSLDQVYDVETFFEARRGALNGFRFRDRTDFRSGPPTHALTPTDQVLGLGDGVVRDFALVKHYGEGASAYVRPIARPVSGSLRVAVGGAETTAFTFVADLGVVRLATPPANGASVTAGFMFDTPVRFESEAFQVVIDVPASAHVAGLALIEIL
jgi:uncharacterized protein (TIGR02217 family)